MDFWIVIALLSVGFATGVFVGAKYINTPSTEINLRKVKIKGENTVTIPEINTGVAETKEKKRILKRIFKKRDNETIEK